MKLLVRAAATLGAFIAATSVTGCVLLLFDEPNMPESLL